MYLIPRVDDILIALGDAKYFTSLNLTSRYWQMKVDEDDRRKSAFTTYNGLFEFIRMLFGLCNAPVTFQRPVQTVLSSLEYSSVFIYRDDVLVASKIFDKHLCHVCEVFSRLCSANFRLKPKKCDIL